MDTTFDYSKMRLGFDENERLVRVFESKKTSVCVQIPDAVPGDVKAAEGSFPTPEAVFDALLLLPDVSQITSVTILPRPDDTIGGAVPKWSGAAKSASIHGELFLFHNMNEAELQRTLAYHWALLRVQNSPLIKSNFEFADSLESDNVKIESFSGYSLEERFALLMAVTFLEFDCEQINPSSGYRSLDGFLQETPILTAVMALVLEDVLESESGAMGEATALYLKEKLDYVKEHVDHAATARLIEIANFAAEVGNGAVSVNTGLPKAALSSLTAAGTANGAKVLLVQLGNGKDFARVRDFTSIILAGRSLTPDMMSALSEAYELEKVDLSNTKIDETYLIPLSQLPKLRTLDLSGSTALGSSIVPLIQSYSLKELDLSRTRINDNAISFLAALKTIEELNVTGTDITEDGVNSLRSQLPDCNIIRG